MLPRQRAGGGWGSGHFRGCAKHPETYQKTVAVALRKSGMRGFFFFFCSLSCSDFPGWFVLDFCWSTQAFGVTC